MPDQPQPDHEPTMDERLREMEARSEHLSEDIAHAREDLDEMNRTSRDNGGDLAGDWRDADGAMGDRPEGA